MQSSAFFGLMKKWVTIWVICFSAWATGQLPMGWQGNYYGILHVDALGGDSVLYAMGLEIHNATDSTVSWTIVYGEDSVRSERNYILKWAGNNQYHIDEQNGILLSCSLIGNQLISVFEVQGNLIQAVYLWQGDSVYFTLVSSNNRSETGNIDPAQNNNEIPLVYTYKTTVSQSATLKRIN